MKKLAVITGGSKGIGKALVEKFAEEGFQVLTCARDLKALNQLKADLKLKGFTIEVVSADLSVKEEVLRFAEQVKILGVPTVLINNTGIFVQGQIHNEEDGVLEKQIQTNLYSAYHLTRALVPAMMKEKKGHIFNMCSTASITPYINGGSYCITKYALLGMTKVLREELKTHGIRVTAILPGATYTSSWEGVDIPQERFMKSEDVASAIWAAYSLSDQAVIEELLLRPQLGDL